jgi:hypothetical protein
MYLQRGGGLRPKHECFSNAPLLACGNPIRQASVSASTCKKSSRAMLPKTCQLASMIPIRTHLHECEQKRTQVSAGSCIPNFRIIRIVTVRPSYKGRGVSAECEGLKVGRHLFNCFYVIGSAGERTGSSQMQESLQKLRGSVERRSDGNPPHLAVQCSERMSGMVTTDLRV